ncbi:MAG: F0F1 ATP synthase subunit B [Calditrichia bacterium]
MENLISVNPGMMIWTWFIFLLLFLTLKKLAWKPLLNSIEQREKTIMDSLKHAQESKEEAEALLEKQRQILDEAHLEAQKIVKEQKSLAQKLREEMEEDARKKIDAMFEKARADIEMEKKAALQELRLEVTNLSLLIAEKLIGENLDKKKQEKLISDYLDKLSQQN